MRRRRCVGIFGENLPRKGNLDGPSAVPVERVVESAADVYGRLQPGNFPFVVRFAAVLIWFGQEEVPAGVERIDLELVVFEPVAVGIDKYFKVVILKNDGVVLGEGCPDMRLLELGGNV